MEYLNMMPTDYFYIKVIYGKIYYRFVFVMWLKISKFYKVSLGNTSQLTWGQKIMKNDDKWPWQPVRFMRRASKTFFDSAPHHPNALVVAAANYFYLREHQNRFRRNPCLRQVNGPDNPITLKSLTQLHTKTPSSPTDEDEEHPSSTRTHG